MLRIQHALCRSQLDGSLQVGDIVQELMALAFSFRCEQP